MKPIPAQRAYFGTRLFQIEEVGEKLLITFKDEIEAIVDAIIGADSIQGSSIELLRKFCNRDTPPETQRCSLYFQHLCCILRGPTAPKPESPDQKPRFRGVGGVRHRCRSIPGYTGLESELSDLE